MRDYILVFLSAVMLSFIRISFIFFHSKLYGGFVGKKMPLFIYREIKLCLVDGGEIVDTLYQPLSQQSLDSQVCTMQFNMDS